MFEDIPALVLAVALLGFAAYAVGSLWIVPVLILCFVWLCKLIQVFFPDF